MKAPLFALPYIDSDQTYHLIEDSGKVIVLTFWASWCPDCGKDLPKKEHLFQTMDHDKVKLLTINVTDRERDAEDALTYAEKFLSQPTLKDNGRQVYDLYESHGVPTTIIIDQKGNIFKQFGDKASFLEIVEAIGELI